MTDAEKKVFIDYYTEQRKKYIYTSHRILKIYNEPRKSHDDYEIASMKERRLSYETESYCLLYIFNLLGMNIFPSDEQLAEEVKSEYRIKELLFESD